MAISGTVVIPVEPGMAGFGSKVDAAIAGLKSFGIPITVDDRLSPVINRAARDAQRDLDGISTAKAQRQLDDLGTRGSASIRGLTKELSGIQLAGVGGAMAFGGAKALQALTPAVRKASELNETLGAAEVTYGDSIGRVVDFGEAAADSIGLSEQAALRAMETFGGYAKMIGKEGDEAVSFAEELTTRAADLGALKGFDTTEVIDMFGSAMRGEMDPIERVGIFLQEATLKNAAFKMGLIETTKEALDPATKAQVVYAQILEQSAQAVGQFDRERDGFAGREKVRSANLENQQAELGRSIEKVWAGASAAALKFTSVLDKIPGGLAAVGVAGAGLGAAGIIGGAVTSAVGGWKTIQEFREGRVASAEAAARAEQDVARSANDAAAATSRAGAAGAKAGADTTAGMTSARVATDAQTAAMQRLTAASVAGELGAARNPDFVAGPGGVSTWAADNALPVLANPIGNAIDVRSREVIAGVGVEMKAIGPAADAAAAGSSRLGAAMSGVASGARTAGTALAGAGTGLRSWLNGLGGMGKSVATIGAVTAAIEGFSFAIAENERQRERGLAEWTPEAEKLAAAFDPQNPVEFQRAMAEIALILNRDFDPGKWSASDVFGDLLGGDANFDNQTAMIDAVMERFDSLLGTVPPDNLRKGLDAVVATLNVTGGASEEAAGKVGEAYDKIDQYEAIQRATGAVDGLGDSFDKFGFKVDAAKGKYGQFIDSYGKVDSVVDRASDSRRNLEDATRDVADAEAEVARLLKEGSSASDDAAKSANDLAEAHRGVESAVRGVRAAERDLADARRDRDALAEELKRVNPTTDPNRFRELSEKVRDANDAVLDAEDSVASAQDSVLSAQTRVSEARAAGVKSTDDLAEAVRKLDDAKRAEAEAGEANALAQMALNELSEEAPEALKAYFDALDVLVAKGALAADQVERIKNETLQAIAAGESYNKLVSSSAAAKPGDFWIFGNKPEGGGSTSPKRPTIDVNKPVETISLKTREGLNKVLELGIVQPIQSSRNAGAGKNGEVRKDNDGREWTLNSSAGEWVRWKAAGGWIDAHPGAPRGTDTVPAWLTPGEHVTNAQSARANAGLLDAINSSGGPLALPGASSGRVEALLEQVVALLAGLQIVQFAPTINARPDQVQPTLEESLLAYNRAAHLGGL